MKYTKGYFCINWFEYGELKSITVGLCTYEDDRKILFEPISVLEKFK